MEGGKEEEEGGEKEKRGEGRKEKERAVDMAGLTAGDEVEFNVIESRQDGKLVAIRVVKLAPGTVSFEQVSLVVRVGLRAEVVVAVGCVSWLDLVLLLVMV